MSINWPKFRIFAVIDGNSYGLLAERKMQDDISWEKVYFYPKGGLRATTEIGKECDNLCYPLMTKNPKEERLFDELIGYARAAANSGNERAVRQTVRKHFSKGYQDTVNRYFENYKRNQEKSPFAEFFIDAPTFKACVLNIVRGQPDKVQGMAEQFGVLSPHQMTSDSNGPLMLIQKVLKVGENKEAEWFRRAGPFAIDFDKDRVYRRRNTLVDLKSMVMNNLCSILKGDAATGKTVLVRQLGYELATKGEIPVYYFNCDGERNFNEYELAQDINKKDGIVIIENIHLALDKCSVILNRIENNSKERHVLFTARRSFSEQYYSKTNHFEELPAFALEPFDDVNEIIEHFASKHTSLPWPPKVRDSIMYVSRKSFWLLSYALEGYVSNSGKGKPAEWVKDGIETDLKDLENIHVKFPQVLVAISPLYCSETLTDESYLRKKGFEQEILKQLVVRGEITIQKDEQGNSLYGLPHSAIAQLYWEHGNLYRKRLGLSSFQESVYDYVTGDVSNPLEAIVNIKYEVQKAILVKLEGEGKLVGVIQKEQNLATIATWIRWLVKNVNVGSQFHVSIEILSVLAHKINSSENPIGSGDLLIALHWHDRNAASRLCELLHINKIAEYLQGINNSYDIIFYISSVLKANNNIGKQLWKLLKSRKLADFVLQAETCLIMCDQIGLLFCNDESVGLELWQLLDHQKIGHRLNMAQDTELIISPLLTICHNNKTIAKKMFGLVNLDKLVAELKRYSDWHAILYVRQICTIYPEVGQVICEKLGSRKLLAMVNQADNFSEAMRLLVIIGIVNPEVSLKMCKTINIKKLANKFNSSIRGFVQFRASAECDIQMQMLLNGKPVSDKRIVTLLSVAKIVPVLSTFCMADTDMAWKFWKLLNISLLKNHFKEIEKHFEIRLYVDKLRKINCKVTHELLKLLNDN